MKTLSTASKNLRLAIFSFASFILLLLCSQTSVAFDKSIENIRFKQEMENSLNRDIKSYLGHDRFLVDIKFMLNGVIQTDITNNSSNKATDNLTSKDTLHLSNLNSSFIDSQDQKLPGMPSDIPEDIKQEMNFEKEMHQRLLTLEKIATQGGEIKPQQKNIPTNSQALSLANLHVSLIIQEHIDAEQTQFLKNLIFSKLDLNILGGDKLEIIKTNFPNNAAIVPESDVAPIGEENLAELQAIWNPAYTRWLITALIVMGFIMFAALFFSWLKKRNLGLSYNNQGFSSMIPQHLNTNRSATQSPTSVTSNSTELSLADLRQNLISIGLGQPDGTADKMKNLLNSSDGIDLAISAYQVLGQVLFNNLFYKTSPQQLAEIIEHSEKLQKTEDDLKTDISDLIQLISRGNESLRGNDHHRYPFQFLKRLSNNQILYLLQDEELRIKALIVSQLPSERAAQVLNKLPSAEQPLVAAELGQFQNFPIHTFQEVALKLSRRALDVPEVENINTDGIHLLMNLIDNMNSAEENVLLDKLKKDDPNTYHLLKQQYYTFFDLVRTPREVISNQLREINRNDLATALFNAPEELSDHVLNALPDKLKRSVREQLNYSDQETSAEAVEQARRVIVNKIRELIRSGKFNMEQLEGWERNVEMIRDLNL